MAGQVDQPPLKTVISGWTVEGNAFVCAGVAGHHAVHTRNIDDRARGFPLSQVKHHLPSKEKIGRDPYVIGLVKISLGGTIDVWRRCAIGVVDQNVDPPQTLYHISHQIRNRVGVSLFELDP